MLSVGGGALVLKSFGAKHSNNSPLRDAKRPRFTEENVESETIQTKESLGSPQPVTHSLSIVDPLWESFDPTPDVRALFMEFNKDLFDSKLNSVEVRWSPRMTSCAGICVYEGRGGLCSVRLSEALLKFRPRRDLVDTLLVYHTFYDEVNNYKVHWWRCNGRCSKRPPYFGWVKRSMNRTPGPNDFWWNEHQAVCGGHFIKVKEPESSGHKRLNTNKKRQKDLPFKHAKPGKSYLNATSGVSSDIRQFIQPTPSTSTSTALHSSGHTIGTCPPVNSSPSIALEPSANISEKKVHDPFVGHHNRLGGSTIGVSRLVHSSISLKSDSVFPVFQECPSKGPLTSALPQQDPPSAPQTTSSLISTKVSPIDYELSHRITPLISGDGLTKPPSNSVQVDSHVSCPVCAKLLPFEFINQHLDECLTLNSD